MQGLVADERRRDPIEDPVLGRLTRDRLYGRWTWSFAVTLPDGSSVRAYTLPEAAWDPLCGASLPGIRPLVGWLRENEPSLRARVAAEMFEPWRLDYWDPDMDAVATPDGLAYLEYHFDSFAGPGAIRLGLDSTGEVVIRPTYPW
jgi:hypothetical protein